jgi:hypothetical protein
VSESRHEDALRKADALAGRALTETEARCTVLGQFIHDCDEAGAKTAAWGEALRELHALHAYRIRIMRKQSLIQQALEYPVGECPAKVPLPPPPSPAVSRAQRQVQVQVRRRRS